MKVFRDSVHGYIQVPPDWCRLFIDTPIFQRLRHIEQTSMRCLYPSARHDRFIHSLGTYHLGKKAFSNIRRNGSDLISRLGVTEGDLLTYEQTFLAACLLHDCAHAPFSHTFEENYDLGGILKPQLLAHYEDTPTFEYDLESCEAAPHEKASAIILLRSFEDELTEIGANAKLAARMVMGCTHHRCSDDDKKRFENALIMLLNGNAVDVDKLDYITRDTWASGVNNVSVDIDRLLGALTVAERGAKIVPAFRKQALSVVQSVVDARNYLYRWIYGHHKVQYDQHLLTASVVSVAALLGSHDGIDQDEALRRIFSLETFAAPQVVGERPFYMVTDGDLMYLIKEHKDEIPHAQEWLSRQHSRRTVWKTRAEFDLLFDEEGDDDFTEILKQMKAGALSDLGADFLYREVRIKELRLQRGNLFIEIGGQTLTFPQVFERRLGDRNRNAPTPEEPPFFLLYQPVTDTQSPEQIRDYLRRLV